MSTLVGFTYGLGALDPSFSYGGGGSGGFNPGDIADLAAWYRLLPEGLVDGQVIDTVSDQSTEGAEDVTQASASLQPTYVAAVEGWRTVNTGGNLLGASLTAWKFLHGGGATWTSRLIVDTTRDSYLVNTLFGPNVGSGIWIYWNSTNTRWVVRIGGRQYTLTPSTAPSASTVHIVTVSWDGSGQVDVYQDGALVATGTSTPLFSTDDQASVLVIGSSFQNGLNSSDQTRTDEIIYTEYIDATQALTLFEGLDAFRS